MGKAKAGWLVVLLGVALGAGSCARVCREGRMGSEDLLATGLVGWQQIGGERGNWQMADGILSAQGKGGWLSTVRQYGDFELSLEFCVAAEGNSGVFLRAPHRGDPAYAGMEVQIIHDRAEQWRDLKPNQYTGSLYGIQAPSERASKRANEWQAMVISCRGPQVKVVLNGQEVVDTSTTYYPYKYQSHPGLTRSSGYIGLQDHGGGVEFRNIRIKPLVD
jgi:3-keto-disaccharide hydrolase